MKYFFICLALISSSLFILNSCSDDNDSPEKVYITATEKVISGKLQARQYNTETNEFDLLPWHLDSGAITAVSSLNEEVGRGAVSSDGSFTLTLNAKIPETAIAWYVPTESGITCTPDSFRCNLVPFRILFRKAGTQADTSINICVLDITKTYPEEEYAFFFSEKPASITGSSARTGDVYNFNLVFGWNIRKHYKENGTKNVYVNANGLPENVIWYADKY